MGVLDVKGEGVGTCSPSYLSRSGSLIDPTLVENNTPMGFGCQGTIDGGCFYVRAGWMVARKNRGWGVVVSNPYGGPYPKWGISGSDTVF